MALNLSSTLDALLLKASSSPLMAAVFCVISVLSVNSSEYNVGGGNLCLDICQHQHLVIQELYKLVMTRGRHSRVRDREGYFKSRLG